MVTVTGLSKAVSVSSSLNLDSQTEHLPANGCRRALSQKSSQSQVTVNAMKTERSLRNNKVRSTFIVIFPYLACTTI
jgi:hypothetical protein